MNDKIKNIYSFYAIAHKLKNTLRSGWVKWGINAERIESVAEHIYGAQMLAFAINSEFDLKLDITKVVLMLAVHELGETVVGDLTPVDDLSNKNAKEIEAVEEILSSMTSPGIIKDLFYEFQNGTTPEAKFTYMIDKLESDLQCKWYDEHGCCDFTQVVKDERVEVIRKKCIKNGRTTFAKAWIEYAKDTRGYDELTTMLASYLMDNKIFN